MIPIFVCIDNTDIFMMIVERERESRCSPSDEYVIMDPSHGPTLPIFRTTTH
jgi:hypothetical protein